MGSWKWSGGECSNHLHCPLNLHSELVREVYTIVTAFNKKKKQTEKVCVNCEKSKGGVHKDKLVWKNQNVLGILELS